MTFRIKEVTYANWNVEYLLEKKALSGVWVLITKRPTLKEALELKVRLEGERVIRERIIDEEEVIG